MACRASTRPRIIGSARSCTIAVEAVMNEMLVKPMTIADGEGDRLVRGDGESEHRGAEAERRQADGVHGHAGAAGRAQARRPASRR